MKQTVGCGLDGNQGAMGVTGVTRVEAIDPFDNGVVVHMGGREFFVPWTSIASCELHKDAPALAAVKGK